MRVIFLIALAVFLWVLAGGPIVLPVAKTVSRDPSLPTFADAVQEMNEIDQAIRDGRLHEDPARARTRLAFIDAVDRYERSNCHETLRPGLIQAAVSVLDLKLAPPTETVRVGDKVLNGTNRFGQDAEEALLTALDRGYLRIEDVPQRMGWTIKSAGGWSAKDQTKFQCGPKPRRN